MAAVEYDEMEEDQEKFVLYDTRAKEKVTEWSVILDS